MIVEEEAIDEAEDVAEEVMRDMRDIMKLQKLLEIRATPYEARKRMRKNSQ